ncbi:MAG: hypothetical protein JJD92_10240 [Frankiaceae bacterium]|nr:hypothetical protein [Frankiaceae bacterium]
MQPDWDTLEWRLVPFDTGTVRSVAGALTPFIGGESLQSLAGKHERGRGYEPAGGYAGLMLQLDPDEWRAHLFGDAIDELSEWAGDRVPLLGCTCGDLQCWPLLARVVQDGAGVRWDQFRQLHRRHWEYGDFGPFVFETEAYERAVQHAITLKCSKE